MTLKAARRGTQSVSSADIPAKDRTLTLTAADYYACRGALARTYLKNTRLLSIRYKCGMIRFTNEQWERIRKHFTEEHIPDGRPAADSDPSCARGGAVDSQHRCAIAYAAAKLSELQNCASTLSNLVHDNHGDCGSPWIAALGQHACGEPSRSPLSAAMLRLLHDRSQAQEFDRRSRLWQRAARGGVAQRRHVDDRAAPFQPQ